MPNTLPIDQVNDALIVLAKTSIPQIYGKRVDIAGLGPRDFDDDGTLILQPVMVRIRFADADYATKDPQRLTYSSVPMNFVAMSYAENLRSDASERQDTLKLLGAVQECFAGARLKLANGKWTEPTTIGRVSPVMIQDDTIDGFYSVQLTVSGIAQFSGPNAHFGEK